MMHIGILGGGQLARMLALAALPMGLKISCIDPILKPCASELIECMHAPYTDFTAIDKLLRQCNVITYENENIPLEVAEYICKSKPLYPNPTILKHSQDRLFEKQMLQSLGIATAPFVDLANEHVLSTASDTLGFPLIIKTRRFGYDGKGQIVVTSQQQLQDAWQQLSPAPLIAEAFIDFRQELSLIAVNTPSETAYYPLTQNVHKLGILRISKAPIINSDLQRQAEIIAKKIFEYTDYQGVLAIEFFNHNGQLLVNEIAPRVHNSGHWTIEGAVTSQFENHVRAICNLPLGDTSPKGQSVMFNCIGTIPSLEEILSIPGTHLHNYNKELKPLRKVGHVTLNTTDPAVFEASHQKLQLLFELPSW